MYRPTVRYDEEFRTYVNNLFHATTLDRNQIIRAALFASAHSDTFKGLISNFLKADVPPSSLLWELSDHQLWMEQTWTKKEEKGDVNDGKQKISQQEQRRSEEPTREQIERRTGTFRSIVTRGNTGGIKVTIH